MNIYTLMSEYKRIHTTTTEAGVKTVHIDECIATLGIYDTVEEAEHWMKVIRKTLTKEDSKLTTLYISEQEMNAAPLFLESYNRLVQETEDEIDQTLKELMDKGFIDQYVDESGGFVYSLTDAGKEYLKNNPRDSGKFPEFE